MSRRKRMMEDLDQDIRDYIERETQDNIERGMSPEEARYAALRKFGNVTRVREDTWEVWSFVWLEQFSHSRAVLAAIPGHVPRLCRAAIFPDDSATSKPEMQSRKTPAS